MNSLQDAINQRVLVLDGSMGVMLQRLRLSNSQMCGRRFMAHPLPLVGNFDILCLSRPEIVADVHRQYLEAGADIIETNTFNGNVLSQRPYGCTHLVTEINRSGARIARRVVEDFMESNPARRCFVAGSMGPTGVAASLPAGVDDPASRAVDFETLVDAYAQQAAALIEGGVDVLLLETAFDILNVKAAIVGIIAARQATGVDMPFMVSATVSDTSGRLLSGHSIDALIAVVAPYRPMAVGLNCSAGPETLKSYVKELSRKSPFPVIFYPNAGLPDELGNYAESSDSFASVIRSLAQDCALNIVGGCCGTTPEHIKAVARVVAGADPHRPGEVSVGWLAGLDAFFDGRGFINIGERCNVAGSRKFLRLINEKNYKDAMEIARRQVLAGAMVLDVNFDDGLLDAGAEMVNFLRLLAADPITASVPWMIDTSDFDVAVQALRNVPGKAILNSLSLKHGEHTFVDNARKVRELGAALVVMLFDEQGQATTFERKIEIAARAYRLLVNEAGFAPEDIIIDPNVLPVATGMPADAAYAIDFIRAVEWIHVNLPGARTSGGISNLSFAFRGNNYLRQAMHAVFLFHAIKAGLSMAILDPATRVTYTDIDPELLERIEDVILNRRSDAASRLSEAALACSGKSVSAAASPVGEIVRPDSVADRLAMALRSGDDSFLEEDLALAVDEYGSASAVVEGPLMAGMELVGNLFEQGKMFLPQVVKSARTMRRAVDILTPLLGHASCGNTGKPVFLLATVKGDVHDIGKNIVKVVLECNNFNVVDLGVQVEASAIVAAAKEHGASFVGLSGLIAPSLNEMVIVAQAFEQSGLRVALFVGGAATSELHTALKIAPGYPSGLVVRVGDAAQNPVIANRIIQNYDAVASDIEARRKQVVDSYFAARNACQSVTCTEVRPGIDWKAEKLVTPSFTGRKRLADIPVSEVRQFINWIYFFNCWKVAQDSPQGRSLRADAEEMLDSFVAADASMKGMVAFYEAFSDGDAVVADGIRIPTPRQSPSPDRQLCMSLCDFVAPRGYNDHIGCFGVSIGDYLRRVCEDATDDYSRLLIQSLCDRLAEATSEYVHCRVRRDLWGYAADERITLHDILRGKYQGIRPAVGYPSLPDQKLMHTLARLISFDDIGVSVTDNGALSPASSVAGFYFASSHARYFTV